MMNFFEYVKMVPAHFEEAYVENGRIQRSRHQQFPLDLYTYTRATVRENDWDRVTSKCRGIIVHRDTGEIIARPFEKFHNYGSDLVDDSVETGVFGKPPVIWEKLDGFMCTMYTWEGQNYIASKGSFHSVHAKWATAELNRMLINAGITEANGSPFPKGYTAVFEGLNRDLRIVVDYGKRQELVLLALIDNETGEEWRPDALRIQAETLGWKTPLQFLLTLEQARVKTMEDNIGGAEGYVLTWYRYDLPPFRLKMKFIEYLRLHRLVTGVSPRHIWEILSQGTPNELAILDEFRIASTPWFKAFVEKWIIVLTNEYRRLEWSGAIKFQAGKLGVDKQILNEIELLKSGEMPDFSNIRKRYAAVFNKDSDFSGICFAMLDKKDIRPIIWKKVKTLTRNSAPMRDGFIT